MSHMYTDNGAIFHMTGVPGQLPQMIDLDLEFIFSKALPNDEGGGGAET